MIIIRNREELKDWIEDLELKGEFKSLAKVVTEQLENDFNEGIPKSQIKIARRLFPKTYQRMPAMFGPSAIQHRVQYNRVRSVLKGEFIMVIASDMPIPTTFIAKGIQALDTKGIFNVPKEEVPETYRYRSKMFAKKLSKALSRKVNIVKTPTHIKFKFKP